MMAARRLMNGVVYTTISWNTDWRTDQAIRAMTTFRRGVMGEIVTLLLEEGLPILDRLTAQAREERLRMPVAGPTRITTVIPQDLEQAIRHRSRTWGIPIYRIFTGALKLGLEPR